MGAMEQYFHALADAIQDRMLGREVFTAWFAGEDSQFVRFNHGKVRQPGSVRQIFLRLHLIDGARHAERTLTVTGSRADDEPLLVDALAGLRATIADLPDDPHLLYAREVQSTRNVRRVVLPDADEAVETIVAAAQGNDLVGFYACGPIYRGFANSFGQRNWHEVGSFNFEWSLYRRADKAAKSSCGGYEWSADVLRTRVAGTAAQLPLLDRAPRALEPGEYRAYFTPAAMNEIVGMLCWGGFGGKSRYTKQSPLQRMVDGGDTLSPAFTLCENTAEGIAPAFQAEGYVKPSRLALIERGRIGTPLINPRTAREYGLDPNGANAQEVPEAVDVEGGDIELANVLSVLGTGLYVSNLWYLNFSDRAAGRLTGMTRFACFWVENGEIVAPLNVMRFDDSVYRLLGSNLLGLTRERELLTNGQAYHERGTESARLPGALVRDFRLTL